MTFEIDATKEVEDGVHAIARAIATDDLVGAKTSNMRVLKGSEDGGQEVETGPVDMVVHQDSDGSPDQRDSVTNLSALVSLLGLGD